MAEPWFDPNAFGAWYGAIAGGVGGTLVGCFGGLIGYLAPRGQGRRFVLTVMIGIVVAGLSQIGFGVVALASGQPYGIWYPPLLCGGIFTVVTGSLIPTVRKRYAEAELRRMEAEAIRQS